MRVVLAGDYVCRGYNPPRGAKKTISGGTVLTFFVHDDIGFMFWKFLSTDLRPYLMNFLIPGWCERYFYLPYIMICWSLMICMDHNSLWRSRLAKICLAAVFISSVTSGFCAKPLPDLNWRYYSSKIASSNELTIPINPEGWEIHLSKDGRSSLPAKGTP